MCTVIVHLCYYNVRITCLICLISEIVEDLCIWTVIITIAVILTVINSLKVLRWKQLKCDWVWRVCYWAGQQNSGCLCWVVSSNECLGLTEITSGNALASSVFTVLVSVLRWVTVLWDSATNFFRYTVKGSIKTAFYFCFWTSALEVFLKWYALYKFTFYFTYFVAVYPSGSSAAIFCWVR